MAATLSPDELMGRLASGLPLDDEHWDQAIRSAGEAAQRAALRSPHLPAKWLWQALHDGHPDAWGSPLVPLLLWGQRPDWLERAALRAHLAMAPRLGWPRVPEEFHGSVVKNRDDEVRQRFGQLARQRWAIEEQRARESPALPARAPARRPRRAALLGASDPTEAIPHLAIWTPNVATKRGHPGGSLVVWHEMQRPVVEPACDEHERRALDLIASVLGATPAA